MTHVGCLTHTVHELFVFVARTLNPEHQLFIFSGTAKMHGLHLFSLVFHD